MTISEVADIFELPFESLVARSFTLGSTASVGFVTSSLVTYGYLGIFVLMVLESASLPIPSEIILPFSGYLVYRGSLGFAPVVLVSTGAGVAGALADYFLSFKFGRPIIERLFGWFGVKSDSFERAEKWISDRGSWSVLAARFIPGMRSVISLPAGVLAMKRKTFVLMTLIGSFGWSMLLVYIGYSAGNLWQIALTRSAPILTDLVLLVCAVASFCYIVSYAFSLRLWRLDAGRRSTTHTESGSSD